MKEYLKMADVFCVPVEPGQLSGWKHQGGYIELKKIQEAGAHAINSHDELVEMNRELLGELKALSKDYVNLLVAGKERIEGLGGECDDVLYMAANDSALVRACCVTGKYGGGAS